MDTVSILDPGAIGYGFIPKEHIPKGKDEYYLRDQQLGRPADYWRQLRASEIETLVKNGNTCDNWDEILVTTQFEPWLVKNNEFFGRVRIGRLTGKVLRHHDLHLPTGISNSRIISCDIGDDVAIHNVRYLSHYIVGARCLLINIDEMYVTNHAKFGNGIVKDGEPEDVRVWLDLINEAGGRSVMPFDGMIPADAYLWAKFRDDAKLVEKLGKITQESFDSRLGFYGTVGEQTIIKSCRIIKDARIGSHCYVKGANKLKNLTINSSEAEPTQIGEGVEMVNGIVGYGCHVFYGCKAVRFIMGNNANLKYGARLIHSFMGDNSTVSCCEMLNNLIFPAHEQHHNNSFLVAALLMGQSNLAAGATVGSNHNSRANDGEVHAGRGFWPGLCVTVKHSCRFASFTLLSKADYPAEMHIPLPFSLVSNDTSNDRLQIMPAFWWLHNMYALARNSWKFGTRDKRITKTQHIEFDFLAPDTAEEMISGRILLERLVGAASLRRNADPRELPAAALQKIGRDLLTSESDPTSDLLVLGEAMEQSHRQVVILKPWAGYNAYGDMLLYYAVKNLIAYLVDNPRLSSATMHRRLAGKRIEKWLNLGGQLVAEPDARRLMARVKSGDLTSWNDIHAEYDRLWAEYPLAKQRHACGVLCYVLGTEAISQRQWAASLDKFVSIQEYIRDQVYSTRKKDYDNQVRAAVFNNEEERRSVWGDIENNGFVKQMRAETEQVSKKAAAIRKR